MALVASVALGLGMTACGGGTIGYLWVLGNPATNSQASAIVGFKIDDYTGNLTAIPHSPFTTGGTNPLSIVVKPGGRFVYVVNGGSGTTANDANVSEFSVGGDGTLTFQSSKSTLPGSPIWATVDSTGSYLSVLDRHGIKVTASPQDDYTGVGIITVFSLDPNTGRMTLVTNQQIKDSSGAYLNFFPVGSAGTQVAPITMRLAANCLYILNGNQTVFPYSVAGGGQLTQTPNGAIALNTVKANSLNTNPSGSSIYVTDSGNNTIVPFSSGGNGCALTAVSGGAVANLANTSNPSYVLVDSRNQFVYVLNQSGTNSNLAYSTISAYTIQTNGQLSPIGGTTNPYAVGAGPVCMVEDPTGQYLYTSNSVDGTITGLRFRHDTGNLYPLARGSTFPATNKLTCLAVSPNVS